MMMMAMTTTTGGVASETASSTTTAPSPPLMQRFVQLFLEGESLQRVMKHLCETSVGQVVDPITDVVCVMVTSPLQLVITEIGVAPFRDRAAHVYPFVAMNEVRHIHARGPRLPLCGYERGETHPRARPTSTPLWL
jgi:hypothetical protein